MNINENDEVHRDIALPFFRPLPQPQPAVLPLILPGVVLQIYAAVPQASGSKKYNRPIG